jgi:hypothetical protein
MLFFVWCSSKSTTSFCWWHVLQVPMRWRCLHQHFKFQTLGCRCCSSKAKELCELRCWELRELRLLWCTRNYKSLSLWWCTPCNNNDKQKGRERVTLREMRRRFRENVATITTTLFFHKERRAYWPMWPHLYCQFYGTTLLLKNLSISKPLRPHGYAACATYIWLY